MQSELKPCAHCGSSDIEDRESVSDYYVACCNCGARTGLVYLGASDAANAFKKRELIAAWNTRASDAEITRLTEALRAAEEREKGLVRLVERAQVNTPDQYVNWHEHARQALAGAKP